MGVGGGGEASANLKLKIQSTKIDKSVLLITAIFQ